MPDGIHQIFGKRIQQKRPGEDEGTTQIMAKRTSYKCMQCNSHETVKTSGRKWVCAKAYEQRYLCRNCGAKFLVWWEGHPLRVYEKGKSAETA